MRNQNNAAIPHWRFRLDKYGLNIETPWFEILLFPVTIPGFEQHDYTQVREFVWFGWKPNRNRKQGERYWLRSVQV